MCDLTMFRHVKGVMKYGIPKDVAKEIVETAVETGNGKNVEKYINYAIDLVYGLGVSVR